LRIVDPAAGTSTLFVTPPQIPQLGILGPDYENRRIFFYGHPTPPRS